MSSATVRPHNAVGWRSEYGGTVYGRSSLVAGEGAYFFGQQTQVSQSPTCESDPTKLMTQEAPTSRFYGRGHIEPYAGMYDMQSMSECGGGRRAGSTAKQGGSAHSLLAPRSV